MELKDKLSLEEAFEKKLEKAVGVQSESEDNRNQAVQALVALGYTSSEALRAVKKVAVTENMDTEAILKQSLKMVSL